MSSFPLHASMQYIGILIFVIFFIFYIHKYLKLPLTALLGYSLISAVTVALNPWFEVDYLPSDLWAKTMYSCTQTALMLILFTVVGLKLPKLIFKIIIGVWVIATMYWLWFIGNGLENGYTFSSAAIVCALPFMPIILWPFILLTAIKFAGATTVGCVGVIGLSLYWTPIVKWLNKNKEMWLAAIGFPILVILVINEVLPGGGLTSSNGRMPAWKAFMEIWWENMPHWFGTGVGSWEWIGPFLPNPTNTAFPWVHNDFLQMLFEGGIVGCVLLVIATGWVLWKVRYHTKARSAALGMFICMMTYYPIHFVSSFLILILICKYAISEEKESSVELNLSRETIRRMFP